MRTDGGSAEVPGGLCPSCWSSSHAARPCAGEWSGGAQRKSGQLFVNVKESVESSFRCWGNKWLPG